MKLTVCFGNVRVIVPCGKGDISIDELQQKACARYRKAIGRDSDYWVRVLQISTLDGGILDWDDYVYDLVEDKDKLVAVYEEEDPQPVDWDMGSITSSDGASNRSALITKYSSVNGRQLYSPRSKDNSLEVDVGIETLKSDSQIMVRGGEVSSQDSMLSSIGQGSFTEQGHRNSKQHDDDISHTRQASNEKSYFVRDATRQSMASGLSIEGQYYNPLRQTTYYPPAQSNGYHPPEQEQEMDKTRDITYMDNLPWFYKDSQEITLPNDGRALGIQVEPFVEESSGKFGGLLVGSIESGMRVEHEGLLACGDVIVEINKHILMYFDMGSARAILDESMHYAELQLRILPVEERERHTRLEARRSSVPVVSVTTASPSTHLTPPASPQHTTSAQPKLPLIAQQSYDNVTCYTRKIGNRLDIQLKKEKSGLGFSITTRDTAVGDPAPIYIRNILPTGAAIQDGRLQAGDRLLEVNGQDMSGMSQEEAVGVLRGLSTGSIVNLVVSRQAETLPRKLKDDPETDRAIRDENVKEFFMFEIPLNDTGSAGLGISLKGNQSKRTGKDLGIFVKAIFHGGAAWQDGRLQANDQLVKVNGHSLTGVTNREAIDILRTSMSTEGNVRGLIQMVVARRHAHASRVSSEASSDLSDSILDQLSSRSATELTQDPLDNVDDTRGVSPPNPDVVVDDEEWSHLDPFNRDSIIRQSISEKRKDGQMRFNFYPDKSNKEPAPTTKSPKHQDFSNTSVHANNNNSRNFNQDMKPKLPSKPYDSGTSSAFRKPSDNNTGGTLNKPVIKKSVSSESLLTPSNLHSNSGGTLSKTEKGGDIDVGPTLGIAKSSSLESLQSAVEKVYMEDTHDAYPRALPKVVRGRLLNDSFRAALDRSYDMSSGRSPIKHMDVVEENEVVGSGGRGKKRSTNKQTKLFGLFKLNKPKRNSRSNQPSESEVYKKRLEENRVKEYQRMQLEKDRIEAKAKELRKMADVDQIHRERPPSVPVTSMQRIRSDDTVMNYHNKPSGRHSVDPTSMRHTPVHNDPSSRKKREFKEAVSMHSSLPRQARREESMQGNPQPPPVPPHHPSYMRVSASMTKFDNREFYNRQKPAATRSKPMSAEKASRPADREARSRTLFYDDIAASRKEKPLREESPEPPSQNFYITQQQERHRGPPDPPVHRHSLHTDTPNRYTPNRRLTRADHEGKSPGEDYAERNRATFYRLLQTQSPNGFDNRVEKIEMSLPYNL